MTSETWLELGLQWASVDKPSVYGRIARALLRWDLLPPPGRAALRELVTSLEQPSVEAALDLEAVQLVSVDDAGRSTPRYAGAALVALDLERRALPPFQAGMLLGWYGRGFFRLRKTYSPFYRERPDGAHTTFAALERRGLAQRHQRKTYRSTVRGWAVARLVEDATLGLVGDELDAVLREEVTS